MTSIGLNISGGEWGGTGGTHNIQYHYPTFAELQFYADKGVDFIRLPIRWERVQDALGGPLDLAGDIALIKQVLSDAAALGMDVIIDVHNYGRYNDIAIGAPGGPTIAQFADFWKQMAIQFKDFTSLVGYDLMNEPHDMPGPGVWKAAAQAATDAIRTVDMNNVIYIEGDGWSSAHTWLNNNSDLIINDPANRIIYQAHGYYDHYNEGMYRYSYEGEGAYPTIGVDRLKPFVEWLQANGLKGMIGEFGIPSNDPRWIEVQKNALDYMIANGLEATAWAGGAWFDPSYVVYTAKPGEPDSAYMDLMEQYFNDYKDPFGATTPPPSSTAPSVVVTDVTSSEAGGAMIFTLTRSGDLSKTSSVNYATANGTASAGLDYTAASGTVTFAPGQATATVSVQIINDTLVESPETLMLNLSGGTNITISDGQAVGTINSDDVSTTPTPPPGYPSSPTIVGSDGRDEINADWSREDYVDAKGGDDIITGVWSRDYIDGGTGNDTISYHWSGWVVDVDLLRATQQSGDADGDVLVNIENITGSNHNDILGGDDRANIINGLGGQDVLSGRGGSDKFVFNSAADANNDVITDYTSADLLDFSAFNPKFLSITNDGVRTRIVGDSNADGVGDFAVVLNGVHTSVNGVAIGSAPPPPPPPPPPTVAVNDVTAEEGAGAVTFTVTRSGSLTNPSTVNFATANGTATAGSDYTALTGTISFAAGEATKTISIALINDTLVESPETFTVNLSGGTNVTIADAQGVGTINSDDLTPPPPAAPSISVSDVTVNEADGQMVFTLARSGDLTLTSSVNYATANGTAIAGSDYTANTGSVIFAAGQASATVRVQILDDTLVESAETLFLNLTAGTNATIADAQGVGTINSDDVAPPPPPPPPVAPSISVSDLTVNEADGQMVFTLARAGDLTLSSSVNYATANGTATAGSDYAALNGSVSFAAGQATATVRVQIVDDTLVENPETLFLNLTAGTNATIADGQGVGTINSNDVAPPPPPGTITGTDAGETINGTSGNDIIDGLGGADVINGGGGADRLTGGAGSDRFVFDSVANANGDIVVDFTAGVDKLDLRAIDADAGRKGSQKFTWIDDAEFKVGQAGQLREYDLNGRHFIAGDTNGDGIADFTVEVLNVSNLTPSDFLF
jgi:Ca2+-binding RTX toxin-like protein